MQSYEHYEKVKRERQERGMEMPPEPTPGDGHVHICCVSLLPEQL